MSTITNEVNAQFDTQRASQIAAYVNNQATQADRIAAAERRVASGELSDMGGGAFRVMTGWDRGEVFNFGANGLLMPQANLDLAEDGKALGYFAEPEWHGLGTVILGGTTDIPQILQVSGGDYYVDKRISRAFDDQGNLLENSEGFQTVRHGGDRPAAILGQVGSRWTPIQNEDGFGFLAELIGRKEILPVSAFPLWNGRVYVMALRLPEDIVLDAQGVGDIIRPYIMARNSFDGRTPFQCVVTPWRPRCSNTERLALRDAITTWKVPHTTNALKRIDEARQTLGLTLNYYSEFAAEEEALIHTDLTTRQIDTLLSELDAELWPETTKKDGKAEPTKRTEKIRTLRSEGLRETITEEGGQVGRNAYAVERAYTSWLDHSAPRRMAGLPDGAARATAILEGFEDGRKDTVHKRLMTLVTR
jgi:phage/plasmid-like protein (TIGR03299 family)